jgi:GTP 3',8-cyclase
VLMRGVNDGEARDLLRFCLDHGYELRFIEQMPLDAQHGWRRETMVTAAEILASLSAQFTLKPDDEHERGSAPAEEFLVDGGPARVGVIASVTRAFCGSCDRVRLTADGQVRNCRPSAAERRRPLSARHGPYGKTKISGDEEKGGRDAHRHTGIPWQAPVARHSAAARPVPGA